MNNSYDENLKYELQRILETAISENPHLIELSDYQHKFTSEEYEELDRKWFVAKLQQTPPVLTWGQNTLWAPYIPMTFSHHITERDETNGT